MKQNKIQKLHSRMFEILAELFVLLEKFEMRTNIF